MEKRGSGLRRIINETKALDGYKDELKPVFKSTTSQFMTTIYSTQYKRSELNGPVNGPVKDPVYGPVKGLSESLKQLYSNATMFLYPSFYEGFGLPVVEALLSGCPVLTSNTSSLPEAGGPGSLKVDPKNVEEIRDGIVTILTNDALRNQMIEKGRQYAIKTFHPETLARKVEEVYNKVK